MSDSTLEEFLAIVQRDLAASSVRVIDADTEAAVTMGNPEGVPQTSPVDEVTLRCELPGGRSLVAAFADPPADVEARRRRLEMLVSAFGDILVADGRTRVSRPPPSRSLAEELAALAQRIGALEVVIIDAFSPVVWGSAGPLEDHAARFAEMAPGLRGPGTLHEVRADDIAAAAAYGLASAQGLRVNPAALGLVPRVVCARHRLVPVARAGDKLVVAMADPRDADAIADVVLLTGLEVEPVYAGEAMSAFIRHLDDEGEDARTYDDVMASIPAEQRAAREPIAARARADWARGILARRAIAAVRALPEIDGLHKGAQLRATVATPDFGYVARSFASIYVIILAYGGTFDELYAKRALTHALPTIERLVAALPPLDPPPRMGGVAAMRPPRRRR